LTSSKLFDLIEIREAAPQQKCGSDGYTSGARGSQALPVRDIWHQPSKDDRPRPFSVGPGANAHELKEHALIDERA